jgi:hypothetical protein
VDGFACKKPKPVFISCGPVRGLQSICTTSRTAAKACSGVAAPWLGQYTPNSPQVDTVGFAGQTIGWA